VFALLIADPMPEDSGCLPPLANHSEHSLFRASRLADYWNNA
jgi:hypothetical protein